MCALMGESGAGKTTLMDVIALRKGGGEISGDVLLNGYPQESIAFRRCSGYVEQFDVQSAELTVRETILFSAQLRLNPTNPVCAEGGIDDFVDNIIKILELTPDNGKLVGNDEDGGLTFEQKKRLSIAVELAASPSIIFLDEPTSGLDARAAMVVMKALRTMCELGRTVVATIHQPNSSVFDMFDDLLLLKKGGETVFFGDLGDSSCNLVSYFEGLGAIKMNRGENPASWMLNVLGQTIMVKDETLNFAKAWIDSSNYLDLCRRLVQEAESQDDKLQIKYCTEFAASQQRRDMLMAKRVVTIYWRSPSYQLSRLMLSMFIALLLGSVFIPIRTKLILSESEITSMLSTIFISFIIIGVLSITSVLPVMLSIRDMYYRHKAAGMLNSRSVGLALAHAEKYFILLSALLFCMVFLPCSGVFIFSGGNKNRDPIDSDILNRFRNLTIFWGFFALNTAIYSYIGQLFMCLVRETGTALILSSVFIGINNFFSGLIVRPQQMMGGLWEITYWINPGHYVYEGLCMSMYRNDDRMVIVEKGSDYYSNPFFDCVDISVDGVCQVSVSTYAHAFFGGLYKSEHLARNAIILGAILLVVRLSTFVALKYLTYSGK
jgi:ABC-type multidrug transport system ATPase subunit